MELSEIVPWGRSMDEYRRMFGLKDSDLKLKILGCGDGPSSFNCEMTKLGYKVISIDPVYVFTRAQIEKRINESFEKVVSQAEINSGDYVWNEFRNADGMGQTRLCAMKKFLDDFDKGLSEKRYLPEKLPSLSFEGEHFDLSLCSHFLFLYSEQLSIHFHIESIKEMLRVSFETRIFPLLNLKNQLSPYLETVCDFFNNHGYNAEIIPVAYEFQRGADKMLKIARRKQAVKPPAGVF